MIHTDVKTVLLAHFQEILGKRESEYVGFIAVDDIFFGCLCGKPFLSISVMHSIIILGAQMPVVPMCVYPILGDVRIIVPEHFHRRGVRRNIMLNGVKGSKVFGGNSTAVSVHVAAQIQQQRRSAELPPALMNDHYVVIDLCTPDSMYQVDYMANLIVTKVVRNIKVQRRLIIARDDFTEIHLIRYALGEWHKKRKLITPK